MRTPLIPVVLLSLLVAGYRVTATVASDRSPAGSDRSPAASDRSPAADAAALHQLAALLSPAHVSASCPRILTFGGNCECNYREPASGRDADIRFDMHLYGQRRVCIGAGYLGAAGRPCRVLSVQRGRFNGDPGALTRQLAEFGCAAGGHRTLYTESAAAARRFSLRRQLQQLGGSRLDLLDVSVPGRDADVLWDLLRPGAKVSADQVALTVVLDENAVLGEEAARSSFSPAVARGYLKMLTRLEALGYRLLSFKPHPSCVESVRRELDICLPILSNTVWIK